MQPRITWPEPSFPPPPSLAPLSVQVPVPGPPPPGADAGVAERLLAERILVVGGDLDDTAARLVVSRLLLLDAVDSRREITLYLDSPDGSATAATAVHDTVALVRPDVVTVAVGVVAGPAQVLLAAGTPGRRHVLPNARVVLRAPGAGAVTAIADAATRGDVYAALKADLAALTARYSGRDEGRVAADLAAGRWFTAAEAVAYGLADHVGLTRG